MSPHKQFDSLGTYGTLSEKGKRKREFVYRGAKVKLRLIILRACTSGLISHLYRKKLHVSEKGSRGRRPRWEVWGRTPPSRSMRAAGFFCCSFRYNKVQFYCRPTGRAKALFLPILDKILDKINEGMKAPKSTIYKNLRQVHL